MTTTCTDDDCPLQEHEGECPDERTLEMWRTEAQRCRRTIGLLLLRQRALEEEQARLGELRKSVRANGGSVDWSTLKPAEILQALQSAPKVAGEWKECEDPYTGRASFTRHDHQGNAVRVVLIVGRQSNDALEARKQRVDKELTQEGWMFV